MNLDTIMSNIYGQSAVQNFDSLNFALRGGSIRELIVPRYVSVESLNQRTIKAEKLYEMTGGCKNAIYTGGKKSIEEMIFDGVEYIENEVLKQFIHEFHLHGLVNAIRPGSVLVIPSKKTLNKWIDELEAEFKKEKIETGSPEASAWLVQHALPYRECIFDLPLRASEKENEGFDFNVPEEFPSKGSKNIVRKHNRGGHRFYFRFNSKDDIEVANNRKMSEPKALKLLGKCAKNVIVLAGDLPEAVADSNIITAAFTGGARGALLRNRFVKLVQKNEGDIEMAAYEFLGSLKMKSEALAKFYSGNYINSAFETIFACEDGECEVPDIETITINKVHKKHQDIVRKYRSKKGVVKMDKVPAALSSVLSMCTKCSSGALANKCFVDKMNGLYKSCGEKSYNMSADIATSLCMNADNFNAVDKVKYAFSVIDGLKNNQTGFYAHKTVMGSPLVEAAYNALAAHPFIGHKSKEYAPLPLNAFEDDIEIVHEIVEKEVVKEVPVEKEVVKEVIVEKIVEKEVVKSESEDEEEEDEDDDVMNIKEVEADDGENDVADALSAFL